MFCILTVLICFRRVYRATFESINSDGSKTGHKRTRAIKVFKLTDLEPGQQTWVEKCLRNEMFVSKNLKHPHVVIAYDVIKTRSHAYIMMLFATNGSIQSDLFERLKRPYKNDEAKRHFSGLANGLQYMHEQNVAHRDLKLDNFLLNTTATTENVSMLADFGFAARVKVAKGTVLTQMLKQTICGTKVSLTNLYF